MLALRCCAHHASFRSVGTNRLAWPTSRKFLATVPEASSYYITTPIYYVNGLPHLGHAYTNVTADIIARYHRKRGRDVHFVTGTDEHGQKVQQSALIANQMPQMYVDDISNQFAHLAKVLGCSNTDFIRTTEQRHKDTVQKLWEKLEKSGHIYLGKYEGWYSVRDEAFYQPNELVNGRAPTGAEVTWVEESSYFFRLSEWTQRLLDHYEAHPRSIEPAAAMNEITAFLRQKGGLRDLSISRTTFRWGISVPGNPEHVVYVWLDALVNYLTAVQYTAENDDESKRGMFPRFWPADLHVVGKDITRFHCIYWPAFLMAAGLPIPSRVFAHGWWTKDGQKMSKSLGNVVDPFELLARYDKDYLRYFLVAEVPFGKDGDFSHHALITRINADLANDLGNLTQRVVTMINKHCGGLVPQPAQAELPPEVDLSALLARNDDLLTTRPHGLDKSDILMLQMCEGAMLRAHAHMEKLELKAYCDALHSVVVAGNRYIDAEAPWNLRKTGNFSRMHSVLYTLTETLRRIAVLMEPVTPDSSLALLDRLGAILPPLQSFASISPDASGNVKFIRPGTRAGLPIPVFPRIEAGNRGPTHK